ncbi:Helix-turn-helix domain-containing protein [Variovorax sp. OK202]|nr:Helix-turn-helix domain-containing protein [Variovorax sp. OK202]
MADIARGTGLSRAQLCRLFSSQDMSVHATLREMRLLKSLSYLHQPKSGQLSIGAIAYACGFSDQAVFSKLGVRRG